jgi:hypothetical protein
MKYHERTFSTNWTEDDGTTVRMTATAEIESLKGQSPHFAVTGHIRDQWGESFGMLHDDIRERIPELVPFLKWHLTSVNKGPMHYIPNALYWAGHSGFCDGKPNDPPNFGAWKRTVVWGACESDKGDGSDVFEYTKEEMTAWLSGRFTELMESFDRDMRILFPGYELS